MKAILLLILLAQATPEAACLREANRYCGFAIRKKDEMLIRGCLAAHKTLFSPKCRALIESKGA